MKSNIIDLTLYKHHETDKALLVSDSEDTPDNKKIWLPKSLCEFEFLKDNIIEVQLPENIAKEKGLI